MDSPIHPTSIATAARRQRRTRRLLATALAFHLLHGGWLPIAPGDWLGIDCAHAAAQVSRTALDRLFQQTLQSSQH